MGMKRMLLSIGLIIILMVMCFLLRESDKPDVKVGSGLRWEKVHGSHPEEMGGSYVSVGEGKAIKCLVVTLEDSEKFSQVEIVNPVVADGVNIFYLKDGVVVDSGGDGKSSQFASEVILKVNEYAVRNEIGHSGVSIQDLDFRHGDVSADSVSNDIIDAIKAIDEVDKFDFHAKIYKFNDSGKVICIVIYTQLP